VTLACQNLLTGANYATIRCAADSPARVRIRVTDVSGDCRSTFPHGTRCTTFDGTGTASGNWEAPWDFGSTWTAMTVSVTCEVLDDRGEVVDTRSTCIPSFGYTDRDTIEPPWSDTCQSELQGCHAAP
jgi:hypothetical protein